MYVASYRDDSKSISYQSRHCNARHWLPYLAAPSSSRRLPCSNHAKMVRRRCRPDDSDDYSDGSDCSDDVSSSDEDEAFDVDADDVGSETSLTDIDDFGLESANIDIEEQLQLFEGNLHPRESTTSGDWKSSTRLPSMVDPRASLPESTARTRRSVMWPRPRTGPAHSDVRRVSWPVVIPAG